MPIQALCYLTFSPESPSTCSQRGSIPQQPRRDAAQCSALLDTLRCLRPGSPSTCSASAARFRGAYLLSVARFSRRNASLHHVSPPLDFAVSEPRDFHGRLRCLSPGSRSTCSQRGSPTQRRDCPVREAQRSAALCDVLRECKNSPAVETSPGQFNLIPLSCGNCLKVTGKVDMCLVTMVSTARHSGSMKIFESRGFKQNELQNSNVFI